MYIIGKRAGNEEMEKSRERRGAKDMLDGVGGRNVWGSLVVHPDESRKTPWKRRDGRKFCFYS